jgi:peptidoglycan LD-endopeptidase LytH
LVFHIVIMKYQHHRIILYSCILLLHSCTTTGPGEWFGKRSPHEKYGQQIAKAGLKETALGRMWFTMAEESLKNPLSVNIPYKESGYFPADKVRAIAIRFEAKRGEKLTVNLTKHPGKNFTIFVDLWEVRNSGNKKLLAYADTGGVFSHEIDDTGFYLIRLQPELLGAGEYVLTITNGPSLAFPVINGKIGSFWGAGRDDGSRSHEGIDIFARRGTPVLAVANGRVSRVTDNKLGGKVIFMRPENKNYSVYYAHLDEQLVSAGQHVKTGDTIGLVGNTGNALSTSPHLHLGIYSLGGAIDPLAFVNPVKKRIPPVNASIKNIGMVMRTSKNSVKLYGNIAGSPEETSSLPLYTLAEVISASSNSYKVLLPDGRNGFITNTALTSIARPLKRMNLPSATYLYDNPRHDAAKKIELSKGTYVDVLGNYEDYFYVKHNELEGWIIKKLSADY